MGRTRSEYAKREEFIAKVKVYEAIAKADPKKYETTCRRLVNLGYIYIFAVLGLILGLIGFVIWWMVTAGRGNSIAIKIILVFGVAIFTMIRALFSRIPDNHDGVDISRAEAPKLWAEVDAMAKALGAPPIHQIRITYDWNASASQIPMMGVIGPCHNTLRYGMPLLAAETLDEARSTIAHELGHFAGGHSKFAGKAYRVVEVWQAAAQSMSGFMAKILIGPFLGWYLPKLWATTFPLRRKDEYEADAAATRLAGPDANAGSLVRLGTQSKSASKAVERIYTLVETQPAPPTNVVELTVRDIQSSVPTPEEFRENLLETLKEDTGYDDTHPAMRDRLAAIDPKYIQAEELIARFEPLVCASPNPSAGEAFFGANLARVCESLNRHWAMQVSQNWANRHRIVAPKARELREAESAGLETLSEARLSGLLSESLSVRGATRSEPLGRELLKRNPDHAEANLLIGSLLVDKLDASAMDYLDRASHASEHRAAAYAMRSHLAEKLGDRTQAARFYDLSATEGDTSDKVEQESYEIEKADLRRWDPPAADLERWKLEFARSASTAEVYAVEFDSKIRPGKVHQLLVILPKYGKVVMDESAPVEKVLQELTGIEQRYLVLPYSMRKRVSKLGHCKVHGT